MSIHGRNRLHDGIQMSARKVGQLPGRDGRVLFPHLGLDAPRIHHQSSLQKRRTQEKTSSDFLHSPVGVKCEQQRGHQTAGGGDSQDKIHKIPSKSIHVITST